MRGRNMAGLITIILGAMVLSVGAFFQPSAASELRQTPPPAPTTTGVVTTLDGKEVQLTDLSVVGHSGIPLVSGVIPTFDYVNRVEFGADQAGYREAVFTFVDGSQWGDLLGSASYSVKISGQWALGSFETELSNVKTIEIQRSSPSSPAPPPTSLFPRFKVITRRGAEIDMTGLWLGINQADEYEFYTHDAPRGIPLANGLEVSLDYISRVDYCEDSTAAQCEVVIALVNGTELRNYAGNWKRSVTITGHWVIDQLEFGSFDGNLLNIKSIEIQHDSAVPIPAVPPSTFNPATVIYPDGSSLDVGNLQFTVRCISGVMCCYGNTVGALPTTEGYSIDFSKVKEIEFLHDQYQDALLPIRVNALDGQVFDFETQPDDPCQSDTWWLIGEAALGHFNVPVTGISKLVFESGSE
ncbi:MAG TPA: hypothetical protein VMT24_07560 [Aggregatilineaceae bacterium]|nr:hypothetical protein [Aggregatilineaceae bacterium]